VAESRSANEVGVPVWITGSFERLSAFALGFFHVAGATTMLGAWLVAKLAASWQRFPVREETAADRKLSREIRAGTLIAVIAGIVSVAVAYLIGLAVRYASEG
jgi:hypothetical protein